MVDIASISTGLQLGNDGIWHSYHNEKLSYPEDGNDSCFELEDHSFWFKHRNHCIEAVVKRHPPEAAGSIFDIGGGNGFVSLGLINAGFNVVLVEPGKTGARNAKKRGIQNIICATTANANFKPHSLPAAGLFDVIEHIEDDLAFLQSLRKLMRNKAPLYITVPAYSFLWSSEDIHAGHYRRYTRKSISKRLEEAGFEIEFSSYIFRFLPVPILLLRTLPNKLGFGKSGHSPDNTAHDHATRESHATKIVDHLLRSEIRNLESGAAMSFGGSCLIVARS